jgi:putative transposase
MPNYRRWRQEGGCFFLTVVTFDRKRFLVDSPWREALRAAMDQACREKPWTTEGLVLLGDHWHAMWRLPQGGTDYSWRVGRVKALFTRAYLAGGGLPGRATPNQRRNRRQAVWQPRFWEHTIRDAKDFWMHLNYIHMNPVKHGLVKYPKDWPWSTFHRWVKQGCYEQDWLGPTDLPGNVRYLWGDE